MINTLIAFYFTVALTYLACGIVLFILYPNDFLNFIGDANYGG